MGWSGAVLACVLASPARAGEFRLAAPDWAREVKAATARAEQLLTARDLRELTAAIDRYIAARWNATGAQPAPPATDAEFLRRVYLDLAGRIPSVAETRAFLADPKPDKRQRLVEHLLESLGYVKHFANVWRDLLLPEPDTIFLLGKPIFELWLQQQFAKNRRYDELVRDLLTLPIGENNNGFNPYGQNGEPTPAAFYFNKEYKSENLAGSTARLFLGTKIECAQCHDHPSAKWTRQQFWEYAAFFGGIEAKSDMGFIQNVREIKDRREIAISGGSKIVQATFLDGTEPRWKYNVGSRQTLAEWLTSPKNPYFSRALANRMWAYFFGTGLVDPVDDLRPENAPSHPELLEELARQFAAHKFDIKFLIRAITASRAYQLSSQATHSSQDDPRLFARMALRGLTPEQIFESLSVATGFREKAMNRRLFLFDQTSMRQEFLRQFASPDKATEFQTSILQSLLLMNGTFTAEVTSPQRSAALAAVIDSPFLNNDQKLETLFLAALSRPLCPEERERFLDYVQKGGVRGDPKAALGDVFWVLLNTPEFLLNH
jgi:hypothetical protein